MSFMPVIRHGVRKQSAVAVKGGGVDGAQSRVERLDPCPRVFVPEVNRTIGAASGECSLDWMKRDIVNGKDNGLILGIG